MENKNDINVSTETNLERFLISTTPIVTSQALSKNEIRELNRLWNPSEEEKLEYYRLGDLWSNNFEKWSAYGVGVPIKLRDSQKKMHFFTPTLSAIQIFTDENSSAKSLREENRLGAIETRELSSDSLSEEPSTSREALSKLDSSGLPNNGLGKLYCQYFETLPPYTRVPFMDKINSLAREHTGLMTLRSVDVSPSSWMAIAWNPIYPIPTSRTVKDFRTCFLTYHKFSSSFDQGCEEDGVEKQERESEKNVIALAPFGLATFKMHGDVWISDKDGRDQERLMELWNAADSWLKQLRVQHHDFSYYSGAC